MAQVPYTADKGPTVEPALTPPSDYENIQPTGFEAVQRLGEKAQETFQHLNQVFGQVAANDAFNGFQKQVSDLMFGEPGKSVGVDADGKPIPDTGFMGLRGRAALDAWPNIRKQMEDLQKKSSAGLTIESNLQFSSDSRRFITNITDRAGSHVDDQTKTYYTDVNNKTLDGALNGIANDPLNDIAFRNHLADAQNALIKNAIIGGAVKGDAVTRAALADGTQKAWTARVLAIGATDPMAALSIVEKNRAAFGEKYAAIENEFRERATTQQGHDIAAKTLSDQKAGVPPPPVVAAPASAAAPAAKAAPPAPPKPLSAIPKGAGADIAKASLGHDPKAVEKAWNTALGDLSVAGGLQTYFKSLPMDVRIATARNFAAHPELFKAIPEYFIGPIGIKYPIRAPLQKAQIDFLKTLPPEHAAAPAGPPLAERTIGGMVRLDRGIGEAPTSEVKPGAFGVAHDPGALAFLNARRAGGAAASADSIAGMRPELQDRLAALFKMAPAEWRDGLRVVSGYRNWAHQSLIHARDVAAGTPWMSASPGGSYHEKREAADIGYGSNGLGRFPPGAAEWLHENASKVGLKFPLSFENWHVELAETRGGAGAGAGAREAIASSAPLPAQATGEVNREVWKSNEANPRAVDAMNYFMKSNGDTRLMAAARAGAMIGESGMNPTVLGPSGDYGLLQVMGPRQAALKRIANYADPYVQMDFSNSEMKGAESKAYDELRAARNPYEATIAMLDYERPGWWLAAGRNPKVAEHVPSFRQRLAATTALMEGKSLGNMIVAGGTNVVRGGGDYRLDQAAASGAEPVAISMTPGAAPAISQAAASLWSSPPAPPAATRGPSPPPTSGAAAAAPAQATDQTAEEVTPPATEPVPVPVLAVAGTDVAEEPVLLDRKQDAYDRIKAMHLPWEVEHKALEAVTQQLASEEVAAGATERQRKQMNDEAADKYTQAIAAGRITPELLQKIDTDPHLTDFHTRMALHEWAMKDPESWSAMSLRGGPGFAKAWSDLIAPSGSPDRITDKSALYRLAQDQQLSPWGLQYLSKMADDVRKDPDRAALNEQMGALFKKAKQYLTFDQSDENLPPGMQLKDPHGVELYNQFVWQFLHGLEAWEKGTGGRGGKDPYEYVTPDNAEKIYKNMRSPHEMALAKLQAAEQLVPANVQLPPPPQGLPVDEHGWHEVMSIPVTFAGQEVSVQKWSDMVGLLASSPTPHHRDLFDKYVGDSFAKAGIDAKDKPSDLVLDVLKVQPTKQETLSSPGSIGNALPIEDVPGPVGAVRGAQQLTGDSGVVGGGDVPKTTGGTPAQLGAKSVTVEQPTIFNPVSAVIEGLRSASPEKAAEGARQLETSGGTSYQIPPPIPGEPLSAIMKNEPAKPGKATPSPMEDAVRMRDTAARHYRADLLAHGISPKRADELTAQFLRNLGGPAASH